MKDKKKLLLVIGALLSVIVITVGVSFAFFNYVKLGSTENSVTTGTITFLYTEVDKVGAGIKLENAVPISDTAGKMLTGSGNVFNFKVTSTTPTNTSIPYEVTARMKKDSTLDKDVVKVYLTKGETEEELLLDKYSNLTQTSRVSENVAIEKTIYNGRVPSGSTNYEENFKLRMWIDSETDFSATTDDEGNTVYPYNNKTFTLTVNVYADAKVIAQEEVDMDNSAKIETVTAGEEVMETVDTETHNYEITLPEGTTSTTLNVEPENPNSTVEIKKLDSIATNDTKSNVVRLSTAKTVPVSKGNNFFQVTVTSENKKIVNQYIINIIVEKNSDNTLKSLNLTNCTLSPAFASDITEYTCTVENKIEETTITAVANNQLSDVVTTTTKQLIVGKNTITIIVTAENGESKTYTIIVTRKDDPVPLNTKIISSNTIITTTPTLTSNSQSAGEKGLYKSVLTDTGNPTYYFRGNVTNNYVSFGGFTWRIVRVNEDGTIRLILANNIDSNTYSFTNANRAISNQYYTNSTIKSVVENWYSTKLSAVTSKVAKGNYFCQHAKHGAIYTTSSQGMSNNPITFKCDPDVNSKSYVNSSVGLLTYEEGVFAGAIDNSSKGNYNFYLISTTTYWTMSPAGFGNGDYAHVWGSVAGVWNGSTYNYMGGLGTMGGNYIRPVINLKADVEWASGNGASGTPYTIK